MAIDATKEKDKTGKTHRLFASWYFPADILFQVKETDREKEDDDKQKIGRNKKNEPERFFIVTAESQSKEV